MANLKDYVKLSDAAIAITKVFALPEDFVKNYKKIKDSEKQSYLTHYIVNNGTYLFQDKPILFERIVQYLSDSLSVSPSNIKLIGSAKTGFTISPEGYGKPYISKNSDLDFSILDETLFTRLKNEFTAWQLSFESGKLKPRNITEEGYWRSNSEIVPRNLKKGFIDSYKIPNYIDFPVTSKINNTMYLIKNHLLESHGIETKGASVRIYKCWEVFIKQLKLNTEAVFEKL
jgi:hypothetical protein